MSQTVSATDTPYQTKHEQAIEAVIEALKSSTADPSPLLIDFARIFFTSLTLQEMEALSPEDAAFIASQAFDAFAGRDKADRPDIRIRLPENPLLGNKGTTLITVTNDDMPFLVDSVATEIQRQGFTTYALYHPILYVERDAQGGLQTVAAPEDKHDRLQAESFQCIIVSPMPEDLTTDALEEALRQVLAAVRLTVEDWPVMVTKLDETVQRLRTSPPDLPAEEVDEAIAFLDWLGRHFVFLGYMEYDFTGGEDSIRVVKDSELGVFRLEDLNLKPRGLEGLPPEVRHFAKTPQLIEITKSNRTSIVHRPVHMDYVSLKQFDDRGNVTGETRFLGLFTSTVYYESAEEIPLLRRKIQDTLQRAGFPPVSHNAKALKTIIEFFPRDELFQTGTDELFETALGILSLEARPEVRLFIRRDRFERFLSCMVFIPKERFVTDLRYKIQRILEKAFNGHVTAYYTQVTESPLARLHVIVKTTPGQIPYADTKAVEAELAEAASDWTDKLHEALLEKHGDQHGEKLYRRYGHAFPPAYHDQVNVRYAVFDIEKIDEALDHGTLALDLFRDHDDEPGCFHLKFFNPRAQLSLSDVLPVLENMGLRVIDETPYLICPEGSACDVWIRDFRVRVRGSHAPDLHDIKGIFEDALTRVWEGTVENDALNKLVIFARLPWQEVVILRAYSKFLKQARYPLGQDTRAEALAANPKLARLLIDYFHARFHPRNASAARCKSLLLEIERELGKVDSITEDRIITRFKDMIRHTLRTNYYQRDADGQPKEYLSYKLDSQAIPELPLPRPHVEIFVYSPRVEGTHLRGGKVARGGLRWSDRREDFRTEVLGLVKAQIVKNSVIVPVGSKGGFVVKRPPEGGDHKAFQQEGIACYKIFLSGLLDITDNIREGEVVSPPDTVCHDEDDPYLVVAADKGTASFSDIANGISREYGFWLDDAFASGGSQGYDHKAMGITARGAWVSVMRHFQEMGRDTQTEDFTVVGIGGMAGDVFGNGMLLSRHIKLIAAFNHMHIFIDPDPDPEISYRERERMFQTPGSMWTDYNQDALSEGAGIYERTAKSITVSKQAQAALGLETDTFSPDELIKALLLAPADLLWNGGIGTYVKHSEESHEDADDRANDALRVDGRELRCKVVGEGGNLGFTQLGRIEAAQHGVRLNTDAIDNSAGVDCSDHEVNIKIAFRAAMEAGVINEDERNRILEDMTEEVAELVLRDNQQQTQAITIAELQGYTGLEGQARMMRRLERERLLDRKIEFLPDDEEIDDRLAERKGLTRPELSVLLAYSKISLYQNILNTKLPDDPYFNSDLIRYFPVPMQKRFRDHIETHRLRREIIATVITNSLINRAGITFFHQIIEDTGIQACDVARAYTICRDAFELRTLWADIEALDGKVATDVQVDMFLRINEFLFRATLWFLRNCPQPLNVAGLIGEYSPGIAELSKHMEAVIAPSTRDAFDTTREKLVARGVPNALAQHIAGLEGLSSACDIVRVATGSEIDIVTVGKMYFAVGSRLELGWLRRHAQRINVDSYWEKQAVSTIIDDLFDQQRRLTARVVDYCCQEGICEIHGVDNWLNTVRKDISRFDQFIDDLKTHESLDLSMLTVAIRRVEMIASV